MLRFGNYVDDDNDHPCTCAWGNTQIHDIMLVVPCTGTDALAAALGEEEEETGGGGESEDTDDDIERTMI